MPFKKNNLFIAALFVASILLPLAFSTWGGNISVAENRYLARFPDVFSSGGFNLNPDLKNSLEEWIKDNVGGREWVLSLERKISYNVFHIIPIPDVVEGKNQWLYLIYPVDASNTTNSRIPTPQHLDRLRTIYTQMTASYKSRGIELTFMLFPNKYIVYPEYMPSTLRLVNTENAFEVFDRELSNDSRFDFRTPYRSLLAGKQVRQDYFKAYDQSHWNHYGAFLGYTALVEQARDHLPGLRVLTEDDFNITTVSADMDTPWGFHSREEDLQYEIKGGYHASSDLSFFETFPFHTTDIWHSYNYFINEDQSLPRAVIVGDSYIWEFMLPDLAESFSRMVFILSYDIDNLDNIIDLVHPDIVMLAGLGAPAADVFASFGERSR